MSRYVLCATLMGLFHACGEEKTAPGSHLPAGEGEGEGPTGEGEGDSPLPGEGEGQDEGEGEGPVCPCSMDAECDDGDFCNGEEYCDGCYCRMTAPSCHDAVPCTQDGCRDNACVFVPVHDRCPDGQICRPAEGGCVAPPPCRDDADCVPDDPCQTGACEAATRSCAFAPFDGDEDGHAPIVCGGDDCDDSSETVNPEQGERCNDEDDNCDGEVDEGIDFMTSQSHCGGCNHECGEWLSCVNGTCQCPEGLTDCGNGCANLQANRTNCGQCGNECVIGTECRNGQCICDDERLTACPEIGCVNLQDDSEHCGTCDNTCEERIEDNFPYATSACLAGICRCFVETLDRARNRIPCESELQCPARDDAVNRCFDGWCVFLSQSAIECDGQCVPPLYSNDNCGACGNTCAENEQCIEGECRSCPGRGERFCQEEPDDEGRPVFVCTDIQNDPINCGQCGFECGGPSYVCTDGACACAPDADRCGGFDGEEYCTDLDVDIYNCGRCWNECPFGFDCQNGQCGGCLLDWYSGGDCDGNCVVCDGMADVADFDSVCSLTDTDDYNCGECENRCTENQRCEAGRCVPVN